MIKKIIVGVIAAGTLAGGGTVAADKAIDPYTQTASEYTLPIADKLNNTTDSISVAADAPAMTLSKWGDQARMTVAYDAPAAKVSRPFLSKQLVADVAADQTVTMTPVDATADIEGGGMEIDINLASKPDTNVFNFNISGAEDMAFYYQPALTDEEIAQGASRPENVVGSYAVYSIDHKDHVEGQTNYATGKLFHIYRPLVTDAKGNTAWAALSYQEGVLSATVPQEFLDNAAYPVVVDPTFGYTSIGGSTVSFGANRLAGLRVTSPSDAAGIPLSSITFRADYGLAGGTFNMEAALYTYVGSAFTLVTNGVSPAVAVSTTNNWYVATYVTSPTLAATTNYGLGIIASTNTGHLNFDTLSGAGTFGTVTYASPASYTDSGVFQNNQYSVYATYTAGGGGGGATANPYDTVLFQ